MSDQSPDTNQELRIISPLAGYAAGCDSLGEAVISFGPPKAEDIVSTDIPEVATALDDSEHDAESASVQVDTDKDPEPKKANNVVVGKAIVLPGVLSIGGLGRRRLPVPAADPRTYSELNRPPAPKPPVAAPKTAVRKPAEIQFDKFGLIIFPLPNTLAPRPTVKRAVPGQTPLNPRPAVASEGVRPPVSPRATRPAIVPRPAPGQRPPSAVTPKPTVLPEGKRPLVPPRATQAPKMVPRPAPGQRPPDPKPVAGTRPPVTPVKPVTLRPPGRFRL